MTYTPLYTGRLLAKEILREIEEHPELFNMRQWIQPTECGTVCCVAGWAAVLNGYRPVDTGSTYSSIVETPDGDHCAVDVVAQDLLELSNNEADMFFQGPEEAIRWLRQYAETGDKTPIWSGAVIPAYDVE